MNAILPFMSIASGIWDDDLGTTGSVLKLTNAEGDTEYVGYSVEEERGRLTFGHPKSSILNIERFFPMGINLTWSQRNVMDE